MTSDSVSYFNLLHQYFGSTIQALSLKVTFDDILEEVGGFGRYQKVLISITTMTMTMTMTFII